ncbi:MAG TPA: MFS transporter [Acidimicrobiales bacterium]|nr:MFS transporter [Acidimicrobiales bacterium]
MADAGRTSLSDALNDAPLAKFHLRAMVTSGMGFFTDAYDLFIIGTATIIIKNEWHLTTAQAGLINSITLISAFVGAFVFGRAADVLGRKRIYGLEAAIMVVGALASALAPDLIWLLVFRFVLGLGIGGDYPVSAVLMSEYANARDRGKLVGLVFSMQALGMIVGPMVGLILLASGMGGDVAWRVMLGLGAVPAAAVVLLRRRMPESPRYASQVQGRGQEAAASMAAYSEGVVSVDGASEASPRLGLRQFLRTPRYLLYLVGTAGTWFAFDYAYYGNSVSAPLVIQGFLGGGHHALTQTLAINLIVFLLAAVPGYYLACFTMDRIGHRRLQLLGFAGMGLAFLLIGLVPGLSTVLVPFLIVFGISYFFAEFGPNTTTFVLSGEVYPVSARTTGHGLSAGFAKVGAFIGVFVFPILKAQLGLSGTLTVTAVFALVGMALTLLLPEPTGRSLEELSGKAPVVHREAEEVLEPAQT